MTVRNGDLANETNFNNAFMSRTTPTTAVKITVDSTDEASKPWPTMTTAQRDALTPVNGFAIYNSDDDTLQVYNGTTWDNQDSVDSVNGKTGVVVLDPDDLDDTATSNKFVSQTEIDKLAGIEDGAEVNTVDSVAGKTGAVTLDKSDVGLDQVDNTSDLDKPVSTDTQTALDAKEDSLGNPTTDGQVLASTTVGVRSWVDAGGGGVDKWLASTPYDVDDVVWLETDNKIYRCVTANSDSVFDITNWQELSEGGLALPSIYKIFNAEDNNVTDFSGITINTTSPINGLADYSVSSYPASLPDVTPFNRNIGKKNTLSFEYKITSGTAKVEIAGVELEIDNTNTRGVIEYDVDDLTPLTIDITDVSSATGLRLDDFVFSDGAREVKEFTVEDTITYTGFLSRSSNINRFKDELTNTNKGVISVDNTTFTKITFNKEASFVATASLYNGASSDSTVDLFDDNDTLIVRNVFRDSTTGRASGSLTGKADKNWYLAVRSGVDAADNNLTNFSVTATAQSSGTVFASDTSKEDSSIKLHTGNGFGSTNNRIRRYSVVQKNIGEAVTYTDSATEGASFEIMESGIYSVGINDIGSSGTSYTGISVNSNQLSTDYTSINPDNKLGIDAINGAAANAGSVSYTGHFTKGDILRPHISVPSGISSANNNSMFYIAKQSVNVGNLIIENPEGKFGTAYVTVASAPQYYETVTATTSYKTRGLNSLIGDSSIGSVSSNQLTLKSGEYNLEIPISGFEGAQWVSLEIYNVTDAVVYETFTEVAYSDLAVVAFNSVKTTIKIDVDTTFEFRTKADAAVGSEVISRIKIEKAGQELGVDALNQVVNDRPLDGSEYLEKGEFYGGKQLYSRTWVLGSNYTTATLLDSIATGLEVKNSNKIFGATTNVLSQPPMMYNSSGDRSYVEYDSGTGDIFIVVATQTMYLGTTVVIEYTKP